ncbi:GP73 [Caviid betaherpesvirus 2]|uniref:GP73 n=1 Tax=Guinea pig cytomegalovirus (strain 22122) TaxID=103920 RepID=B7TPY0_GPCMV|nr:GP73 [Caviid betaherpesvirus 2]AGE11542.1 GP73 [Caviid betaherpesvirus 2]AIL83930.1 GP73 [BAC cloning vector GPN13BACdenovo_preserved(MM)]BAJ78531.1 GP73 [Caviid betaherpesvirus 2]
MKSYLIGPLSAVSSPPTSSCGRRHRVTIAGLALCYLIVVSMVSGASSNSTISPTPPSTPQASSVISSTTVASTTKTALGFYDVGCVSHAYNVSIRSFASLWILGNVFILLCSFGIFLRHCCYRSFASETARGY